MAAFGVVLCALGTALVIAPLDAASLWPWTITPLTGRAIGTFVLAQGVLALTVCREPTGAGCGRRCCQTLVLGVLHLGAIVRFTDTLDWDTLGAWLYLAGARSCSASGLRPPARREARLRPRAARGQPDALRRRNRSSGSTALDPPQPRQVLPVVRLLRVLHRQVGVVLVGAARCRTARSARPRPLDDRLRRAERRVRRDLDAEATLRWANAVAVGATSAIAPP